MTANFNESQMFDSGDGKHFGIKIQLPAQAPFEGLGMTGSGETWWLPHYETGQQPLPGDYFVIARPQGVNFGVLAVPQDRPTIAALGSFGLFVKQDGVAFVTPHNEAWPTSSFGFVYAKR